VTEGYRTWLERTLSGRDNRPLEPGDVVKVPSGEPFSAVDFAKTTRDFYVGEVGWKGVDLIYHFYPTQSPGGWPSSIGGKPFEEVMGDAFLEVFLFPEKLEQAFSEELNSWAVRVLGMSTNLMAGDLASRLFDVLDRRMRQ
jgi:hypothetical protein